MSHLKSGLSQESIDIGRRGGRSKVLIDVFRARILVEIRGCPGLSHHEVPLNLIII